VAGSRIRGSALLNTARYVRETFGAPAHDRVVGLLPAAQAAPFLSQTAREGSWEPIESVVAYLVTARTLLAPEDPAFWRAAGRWAGRAAGTDSFRALLGNDPLDSVRRAAFMWRHFYEDGRLDILSAAPGEIVMRLSGFRPPHRAWCERSLGFLEGCVEALVSRPRAEERACALQGAAGCEFRLSWPVVDSR
jgi:hypothetical protein